MEVHPLAFDILDMATTSKKHVVLAVHDYKSNDDSELNLKAGDRVVVVDSSDTEGWWSGYIENSGSSTPLYFPSNYVSSLEPEFLPTPGDKPLYKNVGKSSFFPRLKSDRASSAQGEKKTSVPYGVKSGVKKTELQNSHTRYRAYGSNMVLGLGPVTAIAGLIAIAWGDHPDQWNPGTYVGIGTYSFFFGLFAWLTERLHPGSSDGKSIFPRRGFAYMICAFPLLFTLVTLIPGIFFIIAGFTFTLAAVNRERFLPEKAHLPLTALCCKMPKFGRAVAYKNMTIFETIARKYGEYKEENKIGEFTFVGIYFLAICVLFSVTLLQWINIVRDLDEDKTLSGYLPVAKAFGGVLNLTCAIIVLPVSRTLIRYLQNFATDHTDSAKFLRSILYWTPIDKSLEFHYLIGWTVYVAALGHAFFHFLNFGVEPDNTLDKFKIWPFISGGIIMASMLFLYSAVLPSVKRGHFEIFWYSHHAFVIFFLMLFVHGRNGLGPNFWKYCIIPFTIYLGERIYREYSAYKPVAVTSVTNMNGKVLVVEFTKESAFGESGYKEGQYAYLNCPHISYGQWHPFTISSAPQDQNTTMHIRIQGQKSWTKDLLNYLTLMGPVHSPHFKLTTLLENNVEQPGKVIGPDGRQILKIYGPFAAPTQRISEYEVDIIVGAGIGVTPVSSCLQSIVHFRWKFSSGITYPSHVHFVWVCSHHDLPSFRWMIRTIKIACDSLQAYEEKGELVGKSAAIHIYITSCPKDFNLAEDVGFQEVRTKMSYVKDDSIIWGHCSDGFTLPPVREKQFEEFELYKLVKDPPKLGAKLGSYVHVYNGRPTWEPLFEQVSETHGGKEIGVAFCGNPAIGKALKDTCKKFSSSEKGTFFKLHKEHF